VQPRYGSHWRLVTLTAPTLPGLSLLQIREVFNTAWSLLRKRDWWRKLVHAGVKGEEFTLGDARLLEREGREWSLEQDGFNFHLHALIYSGWIVWSRLGEEWTDCLRTAAARLNVSLTFNTSHGRAVVDVRLVVNRETKAKGTIRLEGAIEEISKYITKSESWLKVPDAQLVEVASVPRWFRAVELLGECREKGTVEKIRLAKARRAAKENDKQRRREMELLQESISDEERLEALQLGAEIKTERRWVFEENKYVQQDVEVINDFKLYQEAQAWLSLDGKLSPELRAALRARTAYLDTKNLSDGGSGSQWVEIVPKRARGKPLRALACEMDKKLWLEMIDLHIEQVREWRRSDLSMRFQYASFRSLAGHVWYGLRSNPASLQARK
jgi:hypothetical protein